LIVLCVLLANVANVASHELRHVVTRTDAVVVELFYPDNTKFSNQRCEIYRSGEDTPFQVGTTDERGRIVFVPDRSGAWRIRAFSEDGHGVDFTIDVDAEELIAESNGTLFDRFSKIIVGLSLIVGIFGVVALSLARRRGSNSSPR
jgi:nickel transport protein